MNYGEHKFIKLKLINDSSTDDTVTLSTILGYERGGDLIVPENTTLVTEKIRETNYIMASTASAADSNYLRSNLKKEEIGSITFTNDNIVPDGMASVDVSKDKDGTVMMWYGKANSNGLYDVYIGSENGITSIYNGAYMFSYLTKIKSIGLRYADTSIVTNMDSIFSDMIKLKRINISSFNTSNVINMAYMFNSCSSLTTLDLSNFDTSKVTVMNSMFNGCSSLTELDVSNFNTSNVTNFNYTFYGLSNLTVLDVSNFDTSKATNLSRMFSGCSKLTSLDLGNFDTSKVTDMHSMFNNSKNLKTIDFRKADFSQVMNYEYIFNHLSNDVTIYVKDEVQKEWIESKFTNLTNVIVA